MSLEEALQPGIAVANGGFVIDETFFSQVQGNLDYFDDVPSTPRSTSTPTARRATWGPCTQSRPGARVRTIGHLGAKGFYRGAIADAMVETVQHPPVAPEANHVWRRADDDA